MRRLNVLAAVALGAVVASGECQAGGFALREQSAAGQGASFAGAAAPGDSPSAMFWNPAAITAFDGVTIEADHSLILPRSSLSVDPSISSLAGFGFGNGGDVGIDAYVPSFYGTWQVNDEVYLGLSVNSPFGLATHSETPWVGQSEHLRAKVRSVAVTPTVGYRINDMISVGVGATTQYMSVSLSRMPVLASSPLTFGTGTIEGEDWSFGATAGLTLTPMEGTEIGFGYRSPMIVSLDGSMLVTSGGAAVSSVETTAGITLPETVTLGLRQAINDRFTLLAGLEWTNWSRLGTVPVVASSGATVSTLAFEYGDGWMVSLGGEYDFSDQLTLRAGAGYEWSPVKDAHRSMRLPDADRLWLSAGASYEFSSALSLDFAYTHIFVSDAPVSVATDAAIGVIGYGGTAEADIDIISAALRYKFGG
ncbi:OmpP1/FadL family transporter [Hartmannibacter diazotrophicus]|uniref:OmpP1/FadL family transporter n=1 Tax=Hartmannibacter diazotrophicus TaxID=1482074 RepID=UPI0012FD2908|nr:outer membrane protein transport protein [Hartmannibacter diazotrophicus]